MSVFAFPEQKLTEEMAADYRKQTGTALFVISRNSGEGNDRAMTQQAPSTARRLKSVTTVWLRRRRRTSNCSEGI